MKSVVDDLISTKLYFYKNASNGLSFYENALQLNTEILYENEIDWSNYTERITDYADLYRQASQMKSSFTSAKSTCPSCFNDDNINLLENDLNDVEKQVFSLVATIYFAHSKNNVATTPSSTSGSTTPCGSCAPETTAIFERASVYSQNLTSIVDELLQTKPYFYRNASNGISFYENALHSNIEVLRENVIIWKNYTENVNYYANIYLDTVSMLENITSALNICPSCFYNADIQAAEANLQLQQKRTFALLATVYFASTSSVTEQTTTCGPCPESSLSTFEASEVYVSNLTATIDYYVTSRDYLSNIASNGKSFFENALETRVTILYENEIYWENYPERLSDYTNIYTKASQMKTSFKTALDACPICYYNVDVKNVEHELDIQSKRAMALLTASYYARSGTTTSTTTV
jgi:hypothetical protein